MALSVTHDKCVLLDSLRFFWIRLDILRVLLYPIHTAWTFLFPFPQVLDFAHHASARPFISGILALRRGSQYAMETAGNVGRGARDTADVKVFVTGRGIHYWATRAEARDLMNN